MKDHPAAPAGERFLVHRHNRQSRAAMQPGVREGDRHFHPETIDRHRRLARVEGEINQDGGRTASLIGDLDVL